MIISLSSFQEEGKNAQCASGEEFFLSETHKQTIALCSASVW